MKYRVLLIRVVLGLLFAFLLARFFFPAASVAMIVLMAAVLAFFAYVFEAIHKRGK